MGVFFSILFIILAFRSITVGVDLVRYKVHFNTYIFTAFNKIIDIDHEVGYGYLNKIVGIITDDFQIFLAIVALIVIIPIYLLYRKEKNHKFLILIIFLNMATFPMIFSGLRQAIAISIGVLAYLFIIQKKYIAFFLMIALAFTFHRSAFLLLLLYPLFFIKLKAKYLWYLIPLFILFYAFKVQIAQMSLGLMAGSEELAIYSERYNEFEDTGAYGSLVLFILFTLFSYFMTDEDKMSDSAMFLRNILVLSCFIQMVALINPVIMRMNYYFIIFIPIAFVQSFKYVKSKYKNFVPIISVILCCFLTYYYINKMFYGSDILEIYPYKAFWV